MSYEGWDRPGCHWSAGQNRDEYGLVANLAIYLTCQPVIGVDPEPGRNPGVLVRCAPEAVADLLPAVVAGRADLRRLTMVGGTAGRRPGAGRPEQEEAIAWLAEFADQPAVALRQWLSAG